MWGLGDRIGGFWCRDRGLWRNNQATGHGISVGKGHHNWGGHWGHNWGAWEMYPGAINNGPLWWGVMRGPVWTLLSLGTLEGPGVG